MPIKLSNSAHQAARDLAIAFRGDDAEAVENGFVALQMEIAEDVKREYADAVASNDRSILAQRGFHQLTSEETEWYEGLIEDAKMQRATQSNPDGFTHIGNGTGSTNVPSKAMPESIRDEVFRNLREAHQLFQKIRMTNAQWQTTWIRNKHARQLATWHAVESEITKEITSSFETVTVNLGKLSCFVVITKDMLELGPVWMDAYVRTVIVEAMACGLEDGMINGRGAIKNEPVGLKKNPAGVIDQSTGLPDKSQIAVTDFSPETYGTLLAALSIDADGKVKQSVDGLTLVCNLPDYLTKVMPATTALNTNGAYVNNLFPVNTDVVTSQFLQTGEAILFLPDEYEMLIGGTRGIEYSDEYKFLEDMRVFKSVTYANGLPRDNTSALYLDISGLQPGYVNVAVKGNVNTVDSSLDTSLSALTIGSLTLTPTFAANKQSYVAATTNTKDAVTATATDSDAEVTILVNGSAHTSGADATWNAGANVVLINVANVNASRTYVVIVTKS